MVRRIFSWITGVIFLSIVFSGWVFAEQPKEELVVTSQHQRVDYANRIFVYQGEVKLDWKDLVVEADEISAYLTEENALSKIVARGKVRITEKAEERKASCELATYTPEDDKMVLEGSAQYEDEFGNTLLADKVTLWRGEKKMEATGSPVRATYFLEEVKVDSASGKSE
jgi:lipopolysaccharide transport protein LptA